MGSLILYLFVQQNPILYIFMYIKQFNLSKVFGITLLTCTPPGPSSVIYNSVVFTLSKLSKVYQTPGFCHFNSYCSPVLMIDFYRGINHSSVARHTLLKATIWSLFLS